MSSYEEVVSKDLELLWSIQEYCYRTPWLNDRMSKIISKNPLKDIVIVLWIFFILGLVELKEKHFWVVIMNLTVAYGNALHFDVKVLVCSSNLCIFISYKQYSGSDIN